MSNVATGSARAHRLDYFKRLEDILAHLLDVRHTVDRGTGEIGEQGSTFTMQNRSDAHASLTLAEGEIAELVKAFHAARGEWQEADDAVARACAKGGV